MWAEDETCVHLPLLAIGDRDITTLPVGDVSNDLDVELAAELMASVAVLSTEENDAALAKADVCGNTMLYSSDLLFPIEGQFGFFTFMTDLAAVDSVAKALLVGKEPQEEIKF